VTVADSIAGLLVVFSLTCLVLAAVGAIVHFVPRLVDRILETILR